MDKQSSANMNKKKVILAAILVTASGFVICGLLALWLAKSEQAGLPVKNIVASAKHEDMVKKYQASIKSSLADYQAAIDYNDQEKSLATIGSLKNELMAITVPGEYKDLHLKIFLGVLSLEKFLNENNKDEKDNAVKILEEVKLENNWLNQ